MPHTNAPYLNGPHRTKTVVDPSEPGRCYRNILGIQLFLSKWKALNAWRLRFNFVENPIIHHKTQPMGYAAKQTSLGI